MERTKSDHFFWPRNLLHCPERCAICYRLVTIVFSPIPNGRCGFLFKNWLSYFPPLFHIGYLLAMDCKIMRSFIQTWSRIAHYKGTLDWGFNKAPGNDPVVFYWEMGITVGPRIIVLLGRHTSEIVFVKKSIGGCWAIKRWNIVGPYCLSAHHPFLWGPILSLHTDLVKLSIMIAYR